LDDDDKVCSWRPYIARDGLILFENVVKDKEDYWDEGAMKLLRAFLRRSLLDDRT